MGATPEDTQREISRLRGDMTAAIEEVERRFRGGLRGAATSEARISTARAGEEAIQRAREIPPVLAIAGVVVAGAVAYGVYALVSGAREREKPPNRLKQGVSQLRGELSGTVEHSLRQLENAIPHGVLLKLEPEKGGYMRVSEARLEPPKKKRDQSTVIKKFVWAAFLAAFMAIGSVMARRVADTAWRAMLHEEPPTEKSKAAT